MSTAAEQLDTLAHSHDHALAKTAPWSCECADALEWLRALPDRSVSLVFFSPPYEGQRTYGIQFRRRGQVWVDWMRPIVTEACRVSCGLVAVNMSSPVKGWKYSAAVEWLVTDLTRIDGLVCGPSPYAWVKSGADPDALANGIPGSGNRHYHRRDWEPIYTFARPDHLPGKGRDFFSDSTAFGHAPKWSHGGEMSNRAVDGNRVNDPWKTASRGGANVGGRQANGSKRAGVIAANKKGISTGAGGNIVSRAASYSVPKVSNPGNVIRVPVGGGKMGHALAHAGEAPMSLFVAERFICWFVPPGGIVADPFVGTGTTLHAALNHGRRSIGCDVRQPQVDIAIRRLRGVTPTLFGPAGTGAAGKKAVPNG